MSILIDKYTRFVCLEGTEVEPGRKILAESSVNIIAAKDLTDAANKVVNSAK